MTDYEKKLGIKQKAKLILTDLTAAKTPAEQKAILFWEKDVEVLREMLQQVVIGQPKPTDSASYTTFLKHCYTQYQLYWMQQHQKSLLDFLTSILETLPDYEGNKDAQELLTQWEYDRGFDGELYASEKEFLDVEFLDADFMKELLSETDYIRYKKYRSEGCK